MARQFGFFLIFVLILFLGMVNAIYSTPSQGASSSATQSSPYFTPLPSSAQQSSPSLVSLQLTYSVQQGPQAFNRNHGFWNRAFERQDVFADNVNRVGFCPRGRSNFERCPAYPVFDYPFYQQPRSGSWGLRFWR